MAYHATVEGDRIVIVEYVGDDPKKLLQVVNVGAADAMAVAEIKAERDRALGALRFLEPSARELLAVADTETAAYRRRWRMAIEQAGAVCDVLDGCEENARADALARKAVGG